MGRVRLGWFGIMRVLSASISRHPLLKPLTQCTSTLPLCISRWPSSKTICTSGHTDKKVAGARAPMGLLERGNYLEKIGKNSKNRHLIDMTAFFDVNG